MGKGAKVALRDLDGQGIADVQELLGHYAVELDRSKQVEEGGRIRAIAAEPTAHFLMSEPEREQTDPDLVLH